MTIKIELKEKMSKQGAFYGGKKVLKAAIFGIHEGRKESHSADGVNNDPDHQYNHGFTIKSLFLV